jgi:hypothetical protein
MLKPVQQKFFKTRDELFSSDYNIQASMSSLPLFPDNPYFQKAAKENRVIKTKAETLNDANYYLKHRMAYPKHCNYNRELIDYFGDGKSYQGFYQIPQVAITVHDSLMVAHFHPLIDKYQEIMDRSFEAGLPTVWETLFFLTHREYQKVEKDIKKENKKTLDFEAISPFFLILVFGFFIALFAFLCEIFHKDFLKNLTIQYLKKKIIGISTKRSRTKNSR